MMFLKRLCGAGFLLFAVLTACISCSTKINGEIHNDGRAELVLNSVLPPAMSGLLKNLAVRSGAENGAPILDAALLNKALARMTGVETASLKNTAENRVEGGIIISDIDLFLNRSAAFSATDSAKRISFAVWEQTPYGGSFKITMNRDTGRQFLSLLTPDIIDYLSALMAPVATGEIIDKAGYLELAASVYGKAIADELSRAELLLAIGFPGPVEYTSGGTYRGNNTEFKIPLIDLLVLDKPVVYEVRWTPWR
jgi:hypothetical protein